MPQIARKGLRRVSVGNARVRVWLAALFAIGLAAAATAAQPAGDILLVKSAGGGLYAQVEKAFLQELNSLCEARPACPGIHSVSADELASIQNVAYRLVILVGQNASRLADKVNPDSLQLHILISKQDFATVRECCGRTLAIYLEQPLLRQLNFIRFLLPERRRIAVLMSDNSAHYKEELASLARGSGIDIDFRVVNNTADIGRLLHELRDEADLLLSLPDPAIYNQNTLTNILLSTYHNRIPVIGFSRGMVKSGALAALHSTPETVGKEAARKSLQLLDGEPTSGFMPSLYDFSLNRTVARSLHLQLPTDAEINERWGDQ